MCKGKDLVTYIQHHTYIDTYTWNYTYITYIRTCTCLPILIQHVPDVAATWIATLLVNAALLAPVRRSLTLIQIYKWGPPRLSAQAYIRLCTLSPLHAVSCMCTCTCRVQALHICISLVPRLSPCVDVYCVTFDPHEESRGEPGEFYHVSDIKGRENVLKVERTHWTWEGLWQRSTSLTSSREDSTTCERTHDHWHWVIVGVTNNESRGMETETAVWT